MVKIDFKKTLSKLYGASAKTPSTIEVPEMQFFMIDGEGDPNTSEQFQNAIQALYSAAFTLKFLFFKKDKPEGFFEYVVPPLEGLWWMKGGKAPDETRKGAWNWTMMIMTPEFYTPAMAAEAIAEANKKKPLPALKDIRFERFEEGRCAQIMHIGSYASERPTIEKLHGYIADAGAVPRGLHHEIYLSDPRRVPEERWKTIVRHPMRER
jgi:hypothetical protein